MKIAIRVDASSQIGTGHFIRCLTLADALKQRGAQIRFISRHMPEHFRIMLNNNGHEFVSIFSLSSKTTSENSTHGHWLDVSQDQDATNANQALSDQVWDWLIVDHYALDAKWESGLRQTAKRILVIDDIADRVHDCDLLLDQNLYVDKIGRYAGKVPPHCNLLLGPRYALLREEFRQLHDRVTRSDRRIDRIMVFFGGVDVDNYTGYAIKALASHDLRELHVDVVIGALHSRREEVESACNEYGFDLHVQTTQMAELMAKAGLAVSAGGTAIWERCCLGLPTLTICTADNQHKQIADAASAGLLYAPSLNGDLVYMIKNHVEALMENSYLRTHLSNNGMKAVDGRGVLRVVRGMGYSRVEVRAATLDDMESMFMWRNDPAIRAVSRNDDVIVWESHQRWFHSVLNDPDRVLLVGHDDGLPAGVVRFDISGNAAEISIYLVPDRCKNTGLGHDLLLSAERWLSANRPEVSKIIAGVLGDNEPSQHLFLGANYQIESTQYAKRLL